jgi:type I protein arginine methyltransferase
MGNVKGYSLADYGMMMRDEGRMGPYTAALRAAVRPGDVVVDIGAGTGIFSLLACKFGAAHVHAVEPDPSIEVARAIARANGLADRITFHRRLSTEVLLDRPADVVVSDLRTVLPFLQHHVPTIVDARERLLAPGGQLIPRSDVVHATVVEAGELHREFAEPWLVNAFGLDMSAGAPLVTSRFTKARFGADAVMADPGHVATLDYRTLHETGIHRELELTVTRDGAVHGLAVWFDAELADGIGFSNAPGRPPVLYGQAFFPLPCEVPVTAGDRVELLLSARLLGDDYVWRWNTRITDGRDAGVERAAFTQSNLSRPPQAALRRHDADHVPRLGVTGRVDAAVLAAMDRGRPLGEIAAQAAERFPDVFAGPDQALQAVRMLASRYSIT